MPGENYYFYLPRICNHCTNPACLEACPRKAIYKREEDGIVLVDQERCEGYRYCIKACPYKKIYFNELLGKSAEVHLLLPAAREGRGQRLRQAVSRPAALRRASWTTRSRRSTSWSSSHKVALGLLPEKGTEPNVFYVPPFNPPREGNYGKSMLEDPRMPMDYLKYLFGDEVVRRASARLEGELRRAQNGEKSEVLQLLIGRDDPCATRSFRRRSARPRRPTCAARRTTSRPVRR